MSCDAKLPLAVTTSEPLKMRSGASMKRASGSAVRDAPPIGNPRGDIGRRALGEDWSAGDVIQQAERFPDLLLCSAVRGPAKGNAMCAIRRGKAHILVSVLSLYSSSPAWEAAAGLLATTRRTGNQTTDQHRCFPDTR